MFPRGWAVVGIVAGLLVGIGVGATLVAPVVYPPKTELTTFYKTSYFTTRIISRITETSIVTTPITVIKEFIETSYRTETLTLIETSTTTVIKPYCHIPEFSIRESEDPYIDFYIEYCGERLVSKARTQLWDYSTIPGDELNYVHLLVGYLVDDEWYFAEGFEDEVETELLTSDGRYLEWVSHVHETEHDFHSQAHVRMFIVNGYLVIEVDATLTPNKDFRDVADLYVEFGRKSGGFRWTAVKTAEGIVKKDMVYTGEEKYVAHYFEDLMVPRYGWIAGRTLDDAGTLALVFRSAEIITPGGDVIELDRVTPSASDTAGHYDTIELHLIEADWEEPETLKTGYTYRLRYYILMSREDGYEWIERLISFLR